MADVREHGWHLVMIHEDPITRGWVFSVGMWHTLGSPELALFGLDGGEAAAVLNAIGDAIRAGRSIGPEVVMDDMLAEDRLVAFRAADQSWYRPLFGYATWFGQRPPLPIAQVVRADPKGLFPWDADVDEACRPNQPSLWIPTEEHPISPWAAAGRNSVGRHPSARSIRSMSSGGGGDVPARPDLVHVCSRRSLAEFPVS